MKIAPVSGDMDIKLALVAAAAGALYFAFRKVSNVAGGVYDSVTEIAGDVVEAVNPADPDNLVNRGVTAIGSAVVSPTGPGRNADGSWTLGGSLYDITHKDPVTGKWFWQ